MKRFRLHLALVPLALLGVLVAGPRLELTPDRTSAPPPLATTSRAAPEAATTPRAEPTLHGAELERRVREHLAQGRRLARIRGTPLLRGQVRGRRDATTARALVSFEAAGLLRRDEAVAGAAGMQHTRYRLFKEGRPVWNRGGSLRERDGALAGRIGWSTLAPAAPGPVTIARDDAIELARERVGPVPARGAPHAELGFFVAEGLLRPAWRVMLPTQAPFATWQVTLDARDGTLLSQVDRLLTASGSGSVYDPNVALSPLPSTVPLLRLDDSGRLQGGVVRVFDARATAAFRPDLAFHFPPGDPRFVQTSVYRGVTDAGIFAESHGFPSFARPLFALTNLAGSGAGGEFNNAFYDPFFQLLGFGNGDGVLTSNLGTDLDVAAHETGHHVFETLVQPEITSSADPLLAMNEGVADTWAALVAGDPDIGESTIPGRPYLRTLANTANLLDDFSEDPHETGLVYGGANWDMRQLIGNEAFADLLTEALLRLPSDADEFDYRDAFLAANSETRGGAQQAALEQVFTNRAIEADLGGFEGVLEEGIPETRFLPDSPLVPDPVLWNFHLFGFSEFPGSPRVRFRTMPTPGDPGDVDLVVFGVDPSSAVATSENFTSFETIELTPTSSPSVDDDDLWLVVVVDYPDGFDSNYEVVVDSDLPSPAVAIGGPAYQSEITQGGGFEFLTFQNGAAGRVMRVEVEALDDTLDPAVAVFDPAGTVLLGADDDSGPGRDALLQGVALPSAGTFGLVVFSVTADVDPSIGSGRFALRLSLCDNASGPDRDGDGLRDACDDDDDGDSYGDAFDSDPLDPSACFDLDVDGCDDCSLSSAPDPFQDGTDADGDGLCDAGDEDDDNDGCVDERDLAPRTPSTDADLDFFGADCDTCTDVADPEQLDRSGDGYGDLCDCDFDDDGSCNIDDFSLFLSDFATGTEATVGTDMNGDGGIDIDDFSHFLAGFLSGRPGPSGGTP